jgi:hypothetical protein
MPVINQMLSVETTLHVRNEKYTLFFYICISCTDKFGGETGIQLRFLARNGDACSKTVLVTTGNLQRLDMLSPKMRPVELWKSMFW